ncbi:MAG TPA: galactokinase [Caldimonas sp.]|nr:galactokinase [Caldimonas sp.]HEX4235744.1 galactokinase [Caldimonas sp.]
MSRGFHAAFGRAPDVAASAPGRVNLLGEHTDYNDGFVLPIALPQQTTVSLGRAASGEFSLRSDGFAKPLSFRLDRLPDEPFGRYVFGCMAALGRIGYDVPPLDIHVGSQLPMGVGLSSSAALEVATLRAVRALLALPLDDVAIAKLAQRAEIDYAGVRCGIMDQMASSLADTEHALFLDARTLATRLWTLPAGAAVLVLDSGTPRSLVASGYNQRRSECEEACRLLGVQSLREIRRVEQVDTLPDPWRRRARHVVAENARVLRAVASNDADTLGELMNASHASLRDDYEVSTPELDQLVSLLQEHPAVFGAKLTGAGFGGACVAVCVGSRVGDVTTEVLGDYRRLGGRGRLLAPPVLPA